ncbi:MAG: hypothetical protein ABSB67_06380 [Bryobacteraceae bacterium]|jgi:hypothetical protein
MRRLRTLRRACTSGFVFFISTSCVAQLPNPSIEIQLDKFGWAQLIEVETAAEYEWGIDARRVVFDGAGHVYVGFNVLDSEKLATRESNHLLFRVVEFDVHTGSAERTLDFPTHNKRRNSIYVSAKDTLLVAADDRLRVASSGGESFALLTPGHGYFIRQSVSGKTLLVTDHHGRYDDTFLDPDNLEIRTRCVGRNEGIASISDASQFFEHEIRYTPSFAILRGPFCERASTIGTPVPVERVPELHAVDELKYILVWPTRVEVADADRGELSRYATARHEDYGSFDV